MSRIAKAASVALGTGAMVVSGAGLAMADAGANGAAIGSPGFLSGNVVQAPVHIPVNICGNTVNGAGFLNPAFGNTCINNGGDEKGKDGQDGKNGEDGKDGEDGKNGGHSGDDGYGG
ncbi:chaplin family protein [Streptomyces sp. NPDC051315]|uniref:chaplin n=1 Tax=Streptomyces sp. NPDC051315 TaxID=3365650 RepID=UPI0037B5AE62